MVTGYFEPRKQEPRTMITPDLRSRVIKAGIRKTSKKTGIDASSLSLFSRGRVNLNSKNIDKLTTLFGLMLCEKKKRKSKSS